MENKKNNRCTHKQQFKTLFSLGHDYNCHSRITFLLRGSLVTSNNVNIVNFYRENS